MSLSRRTGFAVVPKCNVAIMVRFLGLAVIISGCAAEVARPAPLIVRDSAGVRIVENTVPQWRRGLEWRLSSQPLVSIEANDDSLELGPLDPAAAFIMPTGQIVLLDGMFGGWNRGLVFDSTGEFVRYLGRKGSGPCEFQQVFGGAAYRGDSVAIFDFARRSIFIMGLDGSCGRMVPIPRMRPEPVGRVAMFSHRFFGVLRHERFLVSPYGIARADSEDLTWYRHPIMIQSSSGDSAHAVGDFALREVELDRNASSKPRFYGAEVFLDPYESGIVLSNNTRFEVQVHVASGALTFIARRSHEPVRVTDDDKRAALAPRTVTAGGSEHASGRAPTRSLEQRIAEASWPEFKPAHSNLVVDESGNFWLEEYRFVHARRIPDNPTSTFWSVFDREGAWLGRVEVPGRFLVENIYEDRIIGIWKDSDGIASIRVYTLEKPGG